MITVGYKIPGSNRARPVDEAGEVEGKIVTNHNYHLTRDALRDTVIHD